MGTGGKEGAAAEQGVAFGLGGRERVGVSRHRLADGQRATARLREERMAERDAVRDAIRDAIRDTIGVIVAASFPGVTVCEGPPDVVDDLGVGLEGGARSESRRFGAAASRRRTGGWHSGEGSGELGGRWGGDREMGDDGR